MRTHFWPNTSLLCVLLLTFAGTQNSALGADDLIIGSNAPALDIEHWVQDGSGKFKQVTDFNEGKVYVVEFWATWCGPCIASMPHLAQLQKEYADKGLQIVSISNEDLETVDEFLDRKLQAPVQDEEGVAPTTYRELTSAYCLTTDPDGSAYTDYMQAAKRQGIPCAFIVGKDAKIEWIGHPLQMDQPIKAVLDGSWDREEYVKVEKAKAEIVPLLNAAKFDEAMKLIDLVLAFAPDMQMQLLKIQVLGVQGKSEQASAELSKILSTDETGEMTDSIGWNIFRMAKDERLPDNSLVQTTVAIGEKTLSKVQQKRVKASLSDTLAHLNELLGNKEKAIALQTQAVENASGRMKEEMTKYLQELQGVAEDEEGEGEEEEADGEDK
ncbi:MAG: redoxin domain-containing protein [Planctomycetota bacterium]